MKFWTFIIALVLTLVAAAFFFGNDMLGTGSFKRMVTISGVYAVCRPAHYDVVCFLDADSKEGGMSCMPLSAIGGECK